MIIDLGRLAYADAYALQQAHLAEVVAARETGRPDPGRILLVEHDPVVTIGRHPGAARHLIASPDALAARGVVVTETDRGGDITYHGPGQLVAYPILDLNHLKLGLHAYMRLLEGAVIDAVGRFGVRAFRDPPDTGVWVEAAGPNGAPAKLCAFGVRVRRWVSMHGLALNVTTDLDHFGLIVPCGLQRPVTSLARVLGDDCPSMDAAKAALSGALTERVAGAARATAPVG